MHNKVINLKNEIKAVRMLTLANTFILCLILVWSIFKPSATGYTSATGGNVATNLSINGNEAATKHAIHGSNYDILQKAKRRGYFTASEYAKFECVSLETVYRHANSGKIRGAELVGGRWRIPLMVD
jgi:hypothetical protein